LNILFICDEYPPGKNGGIGSSIQTLSRELVIQGHNVFVAGLYSYNYGQKDYEETDGIKIWRKRYGINLHVGSDNRLYELINKLPNVIKSHLNGKKAFNQFTHFIAELIENEKIDIIEIADYNNFCQNIGYVVNWPKFNIPLILKSHGSHTYFCDELGVLPTKHLKKTDIALYQRANDYSCVSKYTAEKKAKLFNLKHRVEILYNGIKISSNCLTDPRDAKTVVFTGSITEKKGIFSLIKAWNIVCEKFPDAKLLIFGKGKIKPLESLSTRQAKKTIIYNGHVAKDILFQNLAKATLAIFPSYSETFGLGVVEAMSLGCPVIYTKKSCGPEIVTNGVEGMLVDPNNIEEIALNIASLLENEKLRTKLALSAFNSIKLRFNIEYIAHNHISFYNQAIQNFNRNAK
jgi:glycogen synthase